MKWFVLFGASTIYAVIVWWLATVRSLARSVLVQARVLEELQQDDDGDRCICGGEFVPGDDGPHWVCVRCGKRDFENVPGAHMTAA